MTLDEAAALAARLRTEGRRIVLANGCFDLPNAGHIPYPRAARRLRDALFAGPNTDAAVARHKSPARPLLPPTVPAARLPTPPGPPRPRARLSWIVERREAALLRGNGVLDAVVDVDTRGWRRARTPADLVRAGGALGELARGLRAARFDVAVDLQGLVKSGLVTAATRAPLRIGFPAPLCRERPSALFTNRHVTPPVTSRHVVEQYLAVLEPLGVRPIAIAFPLPADPAAEARVDAFFMRSGVKPRDRLVVLLPGAGRADKRWPADRFAAPARSLTPAAGGPRLVGWGPRGHRTATAIVESAGGGRPRLAPAPTNEGPHPPL